MGRLLKNKKIKNRKKMKHQFNHTLHIITPILVGKFSKFTPPPLLWGSRHLCVRPWYGHWRLDVKCLFKKNWSDRQWHGHWDLLNLYGHWDLLNLYSHWGLLNLYGHWGLLNLYGHWGLLNLYGHWWVKWSYW